MLWILLGLGWLVAGFTLALLLVGAIRAHDPEKGEPAAGQSARRRATAARDPGQRVPGVAWCASSMDQVPRVTDPSSA